MINKRKTFSVKLSKTNFNCFNSSAPVRILRAILSQKWENWITNQCLTINNLDHFRCHFICFFLFFQKVPQTKLWLFCLFTNFGGNAFHTHLISWHKKDTKNDIYMKRSFSFRMTMIAFVIIIIIIIVIITSKIKFLTHIYEKKFFR